MSLEGKSILLGVTGSIAAYKAADICSQLGKLGADIHVVLTPAAAQFVGAATFRALTRNPVLTDVFDEPHARRIAHIDLAQSADMVLVAPASADILAKMTHGIADDMLTTCLLATPQTTPLLVAPAMNTVMWEHPATLSNLAILQARLVKVVQPGYGVLACQDVGVGKLADVPEIVRAVVDALTPAKSLQGKKLLITAGATREPLDPVRYLTNRSSGKMGYALAAEAASRGASVTLVSGMTNLAAPPNVNRIVVETAREMLHACEEHFAACDVFIAAAAVADYAPETIAEQKIKKGADEEALTLRLVKNPDILATLAAQKTIHQTIIGFAAETTDLLTHAQQKLTAKNLDLLVANDVTQVGAGFDADTNIVTLLFRDGRSEALPLLSKRAVAARILDTLTI
jgi:phosphopantothenoylcysteine decarboxylase / phosphopantothenate---cysteine ligase